MTDAINTLTLPNGLRLTLRHAPRLKRAAAALRVHAGSHDAPARWPGLAHFLEHLLFLGTARFPLEDGLMRHVQAFGGQVNASTRERTTDFFFEVPVSALGSALERLCQMLAEPDLSLARQHREREVIHAEFIAWSRNAEAQRQFRLLQCVSPHHPLSGFHAGNRYSLALQDPAFQRALGDFHARFYRGGQIHLSLCGPQSLMQLEALGRQFGSLFSAGEMQAQTPPAPLLDTPLIELEASRGGLDLLFAHEHLPPGTELALELLQACLSDSRPGGWLDALRQRGWLQEVHSDSLYAFAGQLLWHIRLQLQPDAPPAEVRALLHGWFGALRRLDAAALNNEFERLQHSRKQAASALELARRDSAQRPFEALDAQALKAFKALLDDLPSGEQGQWQQPHDEPLLIADLPVGCAALPDDLTVSDILPVERGFATLYLRWRIASPLRQRFHAVLSQALQPLLERARRASLQLDFSLIGEHWQLRCAGMPGAVIRTLDLALEHLRHPAPHLLHTPAPAEPAHIPIRALLKALPDHLREANIQPQPACLLDLTVLGQIWASAPRHGLAIGFDGAAQAALGAVLAHAPGLPGAPPPASQPLPARRWLHHPTGGSEHALLLFCPVPAHDEGAGRVLAQALQGPVYQRLRVELQLGYAVFSAFRQIEGQGGLLFGVQSPQATPGQILEHLLSLLADGVTFDPAAVRALAAQFEEPAMANAEVAEWAWQTYLATEPTDLSRLRRSILKTDQPILDHLLKRLLDAEHGWLCLATSEAPDARFEQIPSV